MMKIVSQYVIMILYNRGGIDNAYNIKQKGFTLIELLTIIVLLAVIALISIPLIFNIIEKSKMSAFESNAKMILKAVENRIISEEEINLGLITNNNIDEILGLSNENYSNLSVDVKDNVLYITIVGKNKWDGLIACGTRKSMKVVKDINVCRDIIVPVITLNRDELIIINNGEEYIDVGAIAQDNIDGNLTDKIVVIGTVNPNVSGKYVSALESCFTFDSSTGTITDYSNDDVCPKDLAIPSTIGGVKVRYIGNSAFYSNQLTSVIISNDVVSIGRYAFFSNKLISVKIPDSVSTIDTEAFSFNRLTSIVIPNSVINIGTAAFNNNQLPDEQAFIYARKENGEIDYTKIVSYGGKKRDNVIIPNGVTIISDAAFYNNKLTSVKFPNGLTTIGNDVFIENQLVSVTIPNSVTGIDNNAFYKIATSNLNLTTIINQTGKSFNWGYIVNGWSGHNFVTGTVVNNNGNVNVIPN